MKKQNISKKILYWYDNNKRKLPWRKHVSKKQKQYFTLVSEFMLQQTQVKTVIPYFNNFVEKIPNIEKLAKVKNRKLMKCWEGLGYYSRARNFHESCKKIYISTNTIPSDYDDFINLKGVGPYIASAVLSIAYNKPLGVVDGNVNRVTSRLLAD